MSRCKAVLGGIKPGEERLGTALDCLAALVQGRTLKSVVEDETMMLEKPTTLGISCLLHLCPR